MPTQDQRSAWWHAGYEAAFNDLVDTADAPEAYDLFDLPEGVEVSDAEMMAEFQGVAKALNLTQRQAQRLIDLYIQHQDRLQGRALEGWKQANDMWANQVKEDPELGGDGHARMVGYARAALKRFGSVELNDVLDHLGVGQHPEILRFFARVGRALAEDEVISSPLTTQTKKKSLADRLWPDD